MRTRMIVGFQATETTGLVARCVRSCVPRRLKYAVREETHGLQSSVRRWRRFVTRPLPFMLPALAVTAMSPCIPAIPKTRPVAPRGDLSGDPGFEGIARATELIMEGD